MPAPEAWKVLRLVFLKKPDAVALLSMFSEWFTTVLVDLLHEEKEPIEWRSLHVGADVAKLSVVSKILTLTGVRRISKDPRALRTARLS